MGAGEAEARARARAGSGNRRQAILTQNGTLEKRTKTIRRSRGRRRREDGEEEREEERWQSGTIPPGAFSGTGMSSARAA